MDKSLKEKAVDIKGKKYVLVSDRVLYFNDTYKNGCIQTYQQESEGNRVIFKAVVIPDCDHTSRFFTGYSQAVWGEGYINKTSALENSETSAVGRALAMMGIGVIDSIASVDEINKTTYPQQVPTSYVVNYDSKNPKLVTSTQPGAKSSVPGASKKHIYGPKAVEDLRQEAMNDPDFQTTFNE